MAVLAAPLPALAFEATLSAPGAPDDIADKLRGASSLMGAEDSGLSTSQELLAAALADYRTIVQVLYDSGYFSPTVSILVDGREASAIPLISPPGKIDKAVIKVDTGPIFRFGLARVAPLAPDTEMPEGFAKGETATTGIIREAASAGRDGWRNSGYAKVAIGDQRITANHRSNTLDADIKLIPGQKLRFGNLTVTGNSKVQTAAIRRIAGFPTGEVYSPQMVQKVGSRLRRTGAFSSVALVEAPKANPDGTLDYTIQVAEQLPRRITFGAEVESNSGVTLSAIWLHRNLLGRAERLQLEGEVRNIGGTDDIDGRLAFRLDFPERLGPDNNLFYLGSLERIDRDHYTMNVAQLGVGARRTFSDQLYAELSLIYSYSDADDAYGEGRKFRVLKMPFHAELDRRDSSQSATSGYYLDAKLTPFGGISGSSSGLQAVLDGRKYLSLTETGSIVLAGRVQLGSVLGAEADSTSPDMLFFSGGAGTVRGQPYESLGIPVNGDVAGGRSLLAASAEVRARVTTAISVVGFFDWAAVGSSSFIDGDTESHAGAGLGLRYDVGGFGPIRLDLAMPVSGDTGDGLQFYLGIGQAF
ncbi:autotransporter assembly complex protein TamA [Albibacillus kandeliae]|uniref:autotransporter assembly complex protein TamA n=1 Tax=Albibacillus kandeliae TaxID=2174228 RepID=UPI000D6932F2|nr:BamA/TamA family outer membrane protein [Albibacillus kandeliae]